MLIDLVNAAPLLAWLSLGFFVGLASYWFYRLCAIRTHRADWAALEERRGEELSEARGEAMALRATLSARDAALTDARERLRRLEIAASASGPDPVSADELRLAKYRAWLFDTRARRVRDGGPTTEVRVVGVGDDRELSALKYQNWLLSNRLSKSTSGLAKRAFISLAAAEAPDGPKLRYDNWLLSKELSDAASAVKRGAPIDLAAIDKTLSESETPRPDDHRVYAGLGRDRATPQPIAVDPEPSALSQLRTENSGLRYRNWLLARSMGETVDGLRRGASPAVGGLERALDEARVILTAPGDGATTIRRLEPIRLGIGADEPSGLNGAADRRRAAIADAAAETLRRRVGELEGALKTLRHTSGGDRSAAMALRARLWRSEWTRRRGDAAALKAANGAASTVNDDALAAAADAAAAARRRAAQAESALRALRSERQGVVAPPPTVIQADNGALSDEAASLRRRSVQMEAALRALRADMAKPTPPAKAPVADGAAAAVAKLRSEAAGLRARLWSSEWRLRAQRGPGDASATITALRGRVAELERGATDADGLRRRLQTVEADLAAARQRLTEQRAIEPAPGFTPPPTPGFGGAGAAAQAERSGLFSRRSSDVFDDDIDVETEGDDAPVGATIGAMMEAPLSGAESAALELIDAGFAAEDSNRPLSLLDRPDGGAPDDLKLIRGVGPKLEGLLNGLGVYHFRQLAELSPTEIAWIDTKLAFRGRIVRDRWTPQSIYWSRRKTAGALMVGDEGSWTEPTDAGPSAAPSIEVAQGAFEAARQETVETLAPPAEPVDVVAPLWGVEVAALELIEQGAYQTGDAWRARSLLDAPSQGAPDDLKLIRGVGPKLEAVLNGLGFYYYAQFVELAPQEMAWLDAKLAFRGRLVRDRWVPQAQRLLDRKARGGMMIGPEGSWTLGEFDASTEFPAEEESVVSVARRALKEGGRRPPRVVSEARAAARIEGRSWTGAAADAGSTFGLPPAEGDPYSEAERAAFRMLSGGGAGARGAHAPHGLLAVAPPDGADDLKLIDGVGPKIEAQLYDLGLFLFDQIGRLTASELVWLDQALRLETRTVRDRWIPQAKALGRRKREGQLQLGVEGAWTLPSRGATATSPADLGLGDAAMTSVESDALALIAGGYAADAANRPPGLLDRPIAGAPDDLQRITGVGPKLEAMLNDLGVYYYRQIANFGATEIAWVDSRLRFNGRIARDRWVLQAAELERRFRG